MIGRRLDQAARGALWHVETTRRGDCSRRTARLPMGMRLLIGLLLLTVTGPARQASAADEAAGDTAIRRTADGLIAVGSRAPSFTLPDGGGKAVRLGDLLNRPLVLYFYPMDETPGCTTQACTFRDDSQRFDSLGVRVVGISTDPPSSHRSFADHHQLPFTLLSDTLATVSRLYGVAYDIERSGTKRTIARRVTYLIDREGRVRHVWPKADPAGNSTEVLAVVRKLLPDLHR